MLGYRCGGANGRRLGCVGRSQNNGKSCQVFFWHTNILQKHRTLPPTQYLNCGVLHSRCCCRRHRTYSKAMSGIVVLRKPQELQNRTNAVHELGF